MTLLAIDTCAEACAVAVDTGARRVLRSETIGRGHAERLFGMIQSTMAEADTPFAALQRIAVTVGPGSFTGLRVGVAAARGLALATGVPAIGFTTLAVHAATARREGWTGVVLAILAARGDSLYGQLFGALGEELSEPTADHAGSFAALAERHRAGLAGSGAALVAAVLGADARILHNRAIVDVGDLADLGVHARPPVAPPRPVYVKAPDAEPMSQRMTQPA